MALKGSHWTWDQRKKIEARKRAKTICAPCKGSGLLIPNPEKYPNYIFVCGACGGTGIPPEVEQKQTRFERGKPSHDTSE